MTGTWRRNFSAPSHATIALPPNMLSRPKRPEKVQRTGKIAKQKANGNEIEEYAEGARDAVVRSAALAVHIADGHFTNRRAIPRRQRRNEAVQLPIERNLLKNLTAIGLEGGAEVVNIDAAQLGHQPVRHARGKRRIQKLSTRTLRQPLTIS